LPRNAPVDGSISSGSKPSVPARADVALSLLGFYVGFLVLRALWLGDPLTIPLHQVESGTLVIFS